MRAAMDAVCALVLQLCMLVSAGTLCMQLLPGEAMRGVLRLVCGLLVLNMILTGLNGWRVFR